MLEMLDLLGAILTHAIYVLCILIFLSRLVEKPRFENWAGWVLLLTSVPLGYLLFKAPELQREPLYYVQIGLMLAFLLVEFLLDYLLKLDFRNTRWMVIGYVTLFFGAAGGMLGVAALAGGGWTVSAVVLFFIMAALAFYQLTVTGL